MILPLPELGFPDLLAVSYLCDLDMGLAAGVA